jgi:glycosyltransferase involved in cell wall biosynthesis
MNRPEKMRSLLDSIAGQTVACGRIIVVDGGASVRDVVMDFADRLPVEYYICQPPGQIRQRNMGIGLLDDRTPLVGCLDDDIVLLPTALEKMLECWNRCPSDTAGISFNIINMAPDRHSWLKGVMCLSSPVQGQVLPSGRNTPILAVTQDTQTKWLCGGATVWRREILTEYRNREAKARWAIAEDLIFSYPIGKKYPLYVCAAAAVRHEHVQDHTRKMKHKYYGRTETLWRLYFVATNAELSRRHYFWMQLTTLTARILMGILLFRPKHLQFAAGQMEGLCVGIKVLVTGQDLSVLVNEKTSPKEESRSSR